LNVDFDLHFKKSFMEAMPLNRMLKGKAEYVVNY
jgi:hypothetical protein